MEPNEIDQWFREGFEGFEPEVSDKLWEQLEPQLPPQARKRRYVIFFLFLGIGIGGAMGWLIRDLSVGPSSHRLQTPATGVETPAASKPELPLPEESNASLKDLSGPSTEISIGLANANQSSDTASIPEQEGLGKTIISNPIRPYITEGTGGVTSSKIIRMSPSPPLIGLSVPQGVLDTVSLVVPPVTLNRKATPPQFFVEITPFYGYQHLRPDRSDEQLIHFDHLPALNDPQRMGIQLGGGWRTAISSRLGGEVGMLASYWKQQFPYESTQLAEYEVTEGESLFRGIKVSPVFVYETGGEATLEIWEAGFSGMLSYQINTRPAWGKLKGGVSFHLPLRHELRLSDQAEQVYSSQRPRAFVRLAYELPLANLAPNYGLSIGPQLTYSTAAWRFVDAPFSFRPYQVGIGCRIHMK